MQPKATTMKPTFIALTLILLTATLSAAHADDAVVEAQVTLSNHAFDPQTVNLPAGKKIKLTIVNKDASAAEFESADLDREKVVPANGQAYVYLSPLDAGTYSFYDDFHRKTTTGTLVVK